MEKGNKSLDLLGIKPIADATNTIVNGTVKGLGDFLGRICLPAAEEFGLLLKDKVSSWRAVNAVKIAQKAEKILTMQGSLENKHAHPRLVMSAIENGSWTDNEHLQNAWAGLLASSCTESGNDEGNLIYVNILSQLTSSQVKIFNYACKNSKKKLTEAGWIVAERLTVDLEQLQRISNLVEYHRIDGELDHLRSLQVADCGFPENSSVADLTPTALGLNLFVRCQGYVGAPIDYFNDC